MSRRSDAILRRLDRLGRAVIPREVRGGRAALGLAYVGGEPDGRARPELACVFCGTTEHVIPHRGKGICVDCVREVREIVSGG